MTFSEQFNQKVDILVDRLMKFSNGKQVVNLFEEFNHATLDAVRLHKKNLLIKVK
jgi:hypothetical protein